MRFGRHICATRRPGRLTPGDVLIFVRTGNGPAAATVVGVAESAIACTSLREVIGHVGTRTVYTASEIQDMTLSSSPVLALLFRLDRIVSPTWKIDEFRRVGVVNDRTPQSIAEIKPRGIEWIRSKLGVSH